MLLDHVGVGDLSLDAFVISDVADADGVPLEMKKNTLISPFHTRNNRATIPQWSLSLKMLEHKPCIKYPRVDPAEKRDVSAEDHGAGQTPARF